MFFKSTKETTAHFPVKLKAKINNYFLQKCKMGIIFREKFSLFFSFSFHTVEHRTRGKK